MFHVNITLYSIYNQPYPDFSLNQNLDLISSLLKGFLWVDIQTSSSAHSFHHFYHILYSIHLHSRHWAFIVPNLQLWFLLNPISIHFLLQYHIWHHCLYHLEYYLGNSLSFKMLPTWSIKSIAIYAVLSYGSYLLCIESSILLGKTYLSFYHIYHCLLCQTDQSNQSL